MDISLQTIVCKPIYNATFHCAKNQPSTLKIQMFRNIYYTPEIREIIVASVWHNRKVKSALSTGGREFKITQFHSRPWSGVRPSVPCHSQRD